MFSFFQKPVGIQILDEEVTLVQLKARKEEPAFQTVLREPLPVGVVTDGKILNPEALAQVLEKLRNNVGLTDCVCAIPVNRVFMSVLRLPMDMEANVIPPLIQKRLAGIFPFSPQDLVFDQEILKDPVNNEKIVIIAAMEKVVLQSYEAVFAQAKWTGARFLSGALALARSFPFPKTEHPYAFYLSPFEKKACLLFSMQNVLIDAVVLPLDARDRMLDFFQQSIALLGMRPQEFLVSANLHADQSLVPFLASSLGIEAHSFESAEDLASLVLAQGSAYHALKPVKKDRVSLVSLLQ